MKKTILTCFITFISTFTFAQKITVSGTVNDQQGRPVPFAFIKDAQHNYAAFTDASGIFTLKVDTADRLIISAPSFKGVVVKVADPQNVTVTLTGDGTQRTNLTSSGDAFKEKVSTEGMTKNVATGYIAQENSVHGSRYLFDEWVHGYIITTGDSIKQNDNYLFNYNKVNGSLIFTEDGKAMNEIDKHLIKMFTLVDGLGQSYVFENVPAIDPGHFVEVLATGSKYKIYKLPGTKFIPNSYVSNGMTSSGNNYDEFKDEPVYYAVKMPKGAPLKFTLRNKSIKAAFADDAAKAGKYLSDHDSDIDDNFLKSLDEFMNN